MTFLGDIWAIYPKKHNESKQLQLVLFHIRTFLGFCISMACKLTLNGPSFYLSPSRLRWFWWMESNADHVCMAHAPASHSACHDHKKSPAYLLVWVWGSTFAAFGRKGVPLLSIFVSLILRREVLFNFR